MLLSVEKTLTATRHKQVLAFLGKLPFLPIEQYPGWQEATTNIFFQSTCCFVHAYALNQYDDIVFYAQVVETPTRRAIIEFGPMFTDPIIAADATVLLYRHYKKRMFAHIYILQGQKTSYDTELFERIILNRLPARLNGLNDNCWRTIIVDLTQGEEALQRAYSKGHKSSLKRARSDGVTITVTTEAQDVNAFAEIFIKMYKFRNLPIHPEKFRKFTHAACKFLSDHHLGELIVAKNREGKIIGGGIFIRQNSSVRYYKGASDSELRQLPILHLVIHYVLLRAKAAGAKEFDFTGYPIVSEESD